MELIVFDLDGTLLDTLKDITRAVNLTLNEYGYPSVTGEQVRSFLGNGSKVLMQKAAGKEKIPADMVERYLQKYQENLIVDTVVYSGVKEFLDKLKESCKLAVLSNKPDHLTKKLIDYFFSGIFDIVQGERGIRKPNPMELIEMMKTLKVNHHSTALIGDSDVDRLTAENAGVHFFPVSYGFSDISGVTDIAELWPQIKENL